MSTGKKALRLGLPALLLTVLAVLFASTATAATTIPINPGNVPTTAEGFKNHSCDQIPGGASATQDGWVFVLPGNSGTFVSVTATFKDAGGTTHTVSATVLDVNGTSKAWAQTPKGWTLIAATASITGSTPQDQFNLTHACPATGGTTPSPSPSHTTSPSGSASPSTSTSGTPGPSGSVSPSTSGTPGGTTPPAPTTSTPGGDLPTTGAALTWVLIAGVALAAAGGALLLIRRRRASAEY